MQNTYTLHLNDGTGQFVEAPTEKAAAKLANLKRNGGYTPDGRKLKVVRVALTVPNSSK